MMLFKNITAADRVQFEGRDVTKITPIIDRKSKELTHFLLAQADEKEGAVLRKFRVDEIQHLFDEERLLIDRGFYSLPRETDRLIYGENLAGATKKQRDRINRITFLANRMEHFRSAGMLLTRNGVSEYHADIERDYRQYQARNIYGTDKPNSTQKLFSLPKASTLLEYYRKHRAAGGNPAVFLAPKPTAAEISLQVAEDFAFVMGILAGYASSEKPAKRTIATLARESIEQVNQNRLENGFRILIRKKDVRTYERWIDRYLDPFATVMQREGLAAARSKFKVSERGNIGNIPVGSMQADAWMTHIATLDTTRARYNRMTEEERKAVKRVRRWVIVVIDVATRCILGYSICRNPNERSSLEALRMCFSDKTYLLRDAGIQKSDWNFRAAMQLMSTDSGSEFGKHPFGGALFSEACRRLSGSLLNGTAGISELRGHIERWFFTAELKFARFVPGWTASNPAARNDRKPHEEACLTDDELDRAFVSFVAEYHATPHRGLNFKTPATVWDELTARPEFDPTLPGPAALREACGFYVDVKVSELGVRFAGNSYSSQLIRNERLSAPVNRVLSRNKEVEIKVDPFDLGAISVVTPDGLVTVPCCNPEMRGKSLREWKRERQIARLEAEADAESRSEQRKEAHENWRMLVKTVARSADIGMFGYTDGEIARAARELDFGKGQHEVPYVGREDPLQSGYSTGENFIVGADDTEVQPDGAGSLDRFRSKFPRKSSKGNWGDTQ